MKTLIINAHPDYQEESHYSLKLQKMFFEIYQELALKKEAVTLINLYEQEIPRIEKEGLLSIWDKELKGSSLTQEELRLATLSNKLLTQFKEHHRIVIVSPLHNFNITSRLKDYLDNILIAKKTFKYTTEGSVGLMTDNYQVLLLQASGSIYPDSKRYEPLDFAKNYLKNMFEEIMGFDKFYLIRAEGTSLLEEKYVLKDIPEQMKKIMKGFYK